jgi:hypothetical protein
MTVIQLGLPLQTSACADCPLNIAGRCEGAITRGSFNMKGPSVIGCYDAERIRHHLTDLRDPNPLPKQPSRHSLLSLPSFIPVLSAGMPPETELPELDLYGVSLSTILDDRGNVRYGSPQTLRRGLKVSAGTKLALLGGCNDDKLNKAWHTSKQKDLWRRIADLEFTFVTSFSYSVYDDDPRSDQIINPMKNFATYEYFCSLGIPCIPFLFFNPQSDLDFKTVIKWLEDRPDVTRISMLSQSYIYEYQFDQMLQQMRRISGAINRPIDFLIVGAGAANKLRSIVSEFPSATITTEWPVLAALHGSRILPTLKEEAVPKEEATNAELIRGNIRQFCLSLDAIRQSCKKSVNMLVTSSQHNFNLPA